MIARNDPRNARWRSLVIIGDHFTLVVTFGTP
jgi:hypothetical protein